MEEDFTPVRGAHEYGFDDGSDELGPVVGGILAFLSIIAIAIGNFFESWRFPGNKESS